MARNVPTPTMGHWKKLTIREIGIAVMSSGNQITILGVVRKLSNKKQQVGDTAKPSREDKAPVRPLPQVPVGVLNRAASAHSLPILPLTKEKSAKPAVLTAVGYLLVFTVTTSTSQEPSVAIAFALFPGALPPIRD